MRKILGKLVGTRLVPWALLAFALLIPPVWAITGSVIDIRGGEIVIVAPIPGASGGLGNALPTCGGGQVLTADGTNTSCVTDATIANTKIQPVVGVSFGKLLADDVVYAIPGGLPDATAANAMAPLNTATTFHILDCFASPAPGTGETITVEGKTGTCGATLSTGTLVCTISGTGTSCSSSGSTAGAADDCATFSATASAASATTTVNCLTSRNDEV